MGPQFSPYGIPDSAEKETTTFSQFFATFVSIHAALQSAPTRILTKFVGPLDLKIL